MFFQLQLPDIDKTIETLYNLFLRSLHEITIQKLYTLYYISHSDSIITQHYIYIYIYISIDFNLMMIPSYLSLILLLSLTHPSTNTFIQQSAFINIVSNKAIQLSPASQTNNNRLAYYQYLKNVTYIYDLDNNNQLIKNFTAYREKQPVKYLSWIQEGILLVGEKWKQIVNVSDYSTVSYQQFDENRTAVEQVVVSADRRSFAINLGDIIEVYRDDSLVRSISPIEQQNVGFSGLCFFQNPDHLNYFQQTNTNKYTRIVRSITTDQIIYTQKQLPQFIMTKLSPKQNLIFALSKQVGLQTFTTQSPYDAKQTIFVNSTQYDMIEWINDDLLACATFKGQVDIWEIDYTNLSNSKMVQEIKKQGNREYDNDRIIYMTAGNGYIVVYTEEFDIYVISNYQGISTAVFYIISALAVVIIIAIIVFCIIRKKKNNNKEQFEYQSEKQPKTNDGLHDYLKS